MILNDLWTQFQGIGGVVVVRGGWSSVCRRLNWELQWFWVQALLQTKDGRCSSSGGRATDIQSAAKVPVSRVPKHPHWTSLHPYARGVVSRTLPIAPKGIKPSRKQDEMRISVTPVLNFDWIHHSLIYNEIHTILRAHLASKKCRLKKPEDKQICRKRKTWFYCLHC